MVLGESVVVELVDDDKRERALPLQPIAARYATECQDLPNLVISFLLNSLKFLKSPRDGG